jgi:hypothetical protein
MHRHLLCPMLLAVALLVPGVRSVSAEPLPASVLVLDNRPTNGALNLGGEDRLVVDKGDLQVNSTHSNAVFNALSQIEVKDGGCRIAGGYNGVGTATCAPEAETGASAVADPYAQTAWPQTTDIASRGKLFVSGDNKEETLSPGYYVGGLSCMGKGLVVHLEPGLYIITDGDFFISDATVEGTDVTILMSGNAPGKLLAANGSHLIISAPKEGPLKDLALVSARTMQGNDTDLGFNGGVAEVDGVIYAPRGRVGVFFKSQVTAAAVVSWHLMLNTGGVLEALGERQPQEAQQN